MRDGSPLNLVVLVRVGSDGLDEQTRALSADGVVAYSAICTHQGCPVNQWSKEKKAMVCSCHGSTYDPKNSAEVIFGPAPLPLAGLPLKSENGLLIVAGGFTAASAGKRIDAVGFAVTQPLAGRHVGDKQGLYNGGGKHEEAAYLAQAWRCSLMAGTLGVAYAPTTPRSPMRVSRTRSRRTG